ncbi:Ldh family oxidoreductase [Alphaproteobacteria bacterium]|nr:Ldh family oxidoreductase [Alphaproteobacteria bacterium]
MSQDFVNMTRSQAESLIADAFINSKVSEANAKAVAQALVAAEVDGQKGHGFSRVGSYAAQSKSGKVDGFATPELTRDKPSFLKVDAKNGFAYPAVEMAIEALVGAARSNGIAGVAISNSHHCGQLSRHVEQLAERGLLAIMVANTPKAMAPWGGSKPLFGTNPIAFGVPRDGAAPLVIDLSMSKVARGKIMAANKASETIPEGWALDSKGNDTTDPKAALAGSMIPMGDAKGAALALLVEILAATVTGSNYSYEATSFFDGEGKPPSVGQFILAIDTGATHDLFAQRLEGLLSEMLEQDGTRLPGQKRLNGRKMCEEHGVSVPKAVLEEIKALAV